MEIRELNIKKKYYSSLKSINKYQLEKTYQDDYNYRAHKKSFLCYKSYIYFWFGIFHDSLSVFSSRLSTNLYFNEQFF